MDQKWILYPPNSEPGATVEKAFRARGLALPQASVTTHSHYLRDILLATEKYLAITPISMLGVYNRNRVAVKRLALDLGIKSSPMAIFTLRHRTSSPVIELFIESVRATAMTIHSRSG
jgi:DNA-binding transcriptional LysR family regulator